MTSLKVSLKKQLQHLQHLKRMNHAAVKVVLVLMMVFGNIQPASSYETETHFYVTYVLARSAGFSDRAAKILAVSAQKIDDNTLTSPMYFELARLLYHFSGSPEINEVNAHGNASKIKAAMVGTVRKLFNVRMKLQQMLAVATQDHAIPHQLMTIALQGGDIIAAGKATHSSQDNASAHVGFASGPGHGEFGHATDDSAENTAGFEHMVETVLQRLVQLRHVAAPQDVDLRGALRFLNEGLGKNERLTSADLQDSTKISATLLKKNDFQNAYLTLLKNTTEYKKIALHRIVEAYAKLGAVKNKEELLESLPKELIEDPTVSTKDILMTLFVASEKYGDFLKFVDPRSGHEVDILDLDKALAGGQKTGESRAQFHARITDEARKLEAELNILEDKFASYQEAKENLQKVADETAETAETANKIANMLGDKYPDLLGSLAKLIEFELAQQFADSPEIAKARVAVHSDFKRAVVQVRADIQASPNAENQGIGRKLIEYRDQLLENAADFTRAKQAYFRKSTVLENALAKVQISKDEFMSAGEMTSEMKIYLADSNWKIHKAVSVAQIQAAEALADNILESFVPLEFGPKRHVVFENDSSYNRQFHIRTKMEIWRSFTARHFGTNFTYSDKSVSSLKNIGNVKAAFDVKLARQEFKQFTDEQLVERLSTEQYKRILSELARRTSEKILGYGPVEPKERVQKLGFDKPAARAFTRNTLKVFKEAGFGLSQWVRTFVAEAEAHGRDYLFLSKTELQIKYPTLNKNKAANAQMNVYEEMEEQYQAEKTRRVFARGGRCVDVFSARGNTRLFAD